MELTGTLQGPLLCRLPWNLRSPAITPSLLAFPLESGRIRRKKSLSVRLNASSAPSFGIAPAISLTDKALNHLNKMRDEKTENLCLRIGVKQGGCSGMSYTMEFENGANARSDDSLIEYNGFTIGKVKEKLRLLHRSGNICGAHFMN